MVPLKLQGVYPATLVCFNAATTSCFSQAAREAKFIFGDSRILSAYESLSGKSYPSTTDFSVLAFKRYWIDYTALSVGCQEEFLFYMSAASAKCEWAAP